METRIIETEEEMKQVEELRQEVYHLPELGTHYYDALHANKEYALVAFDDDVMVGACYFHRFDRNLVIDQVFVKESYQNRKLRIGRGLILQLLQSRKMLEDLLGGPLDMCRIESRGEKAHSLYKKIGFQEGKMDEDSMYKHI